MAELDLLRSLPFETAEASAAARARARGRLLRRIKRTPSPHRRRLLLAAAGLVTAGAIATFVGVGTHGEGGASAAPLLRKIATTARAQPPTKPLTRGQFAYTKSLVAWMSGGEGWNALSPGTRESWYGRTRARIHERWGKPKFPSAADRAGWIAAGRPQVNPPEDSADFPVTPHPDLPTNPDVLYEKIHDDAVGRGNGTLPEMFTLVADNLKETGASPALRAALYEVAARIPGVELIGPATDRLGRHGVAVAYVDAKIHERHELIFDLRTSNLLGEEYVQLDGNPYGYPAGTVTGYATYVVNAVVNRLGERP
jgi:hypothetical protein